MGATQFLNQTWLSIMLLIIEIISNVFAELQIGVSCFNDYYVQGLNTC